MKRIVLCADDFGQAPAISGGILDLVSRQRLSAVSCMVNMGYWPEHARDLLAYQQHIDIGLHFNLTQGEPLSAKFKKMHGKHFPSLPMLIRKAYLNELHHEAIVAELNAQIDAFAAVTGCLPNFLDGHQHAHHLPGVRKAVLEVFNDRLKSNQSYIRLVSMRLTPADLFNKKLVIYATGVRRFRQLLSVHEIPHNRTFSGIYKFKQASNYPALFRGFLKEVEAGGLIMCHPGFAPDGEPDEIGDARVREYNYLISEEFEQDLIAEKVLLSRFVDL